MKKKLFQYAVIWHPNPQEEKEGLSSKFLVELTTVLSNSQQELTMEAAMDIPKEYKGQSSQIEIVVRPF